MSRAYRISVSQTVQKHIHAVDGIRTRLELLAVLTAPEMGELLVAELKRRGFVCVDSGDGADESAREGNGESRRMLRTDDDGVELCIVTSGDRAGEVCARLALDKDLELTVERSKRAYEEHAEIERERLQRSVDKAMARREQSERQELSAEVTAVLEGKLRDVRAELASISNRVTADALKIRAGQLGEIREMSEDPETGSLTIRVRL